MRLGRSLAATLVLLGCSKKDDPPAARKDDKQPAPDAAPRRDPPPPTPDAPAAPAAEAMVEHDLSPAGAAWTGWSVLAPPDGKLESYVDQDMVKGGIVIRWGNGAGAMGFVQKKLDFKKWKQDFQATGDTKVDAETAHRLDATMTMIGTELRCFYVNKTVGGGDAGCWTVSCVGDDAGLAGANAICESLTRK